MNEFMEELWEKVRRVLFDRQISYRHTFNPESQMAIIVLKDLAKFCRAHETTFHQDPRVHAMLEGRKEVWIRIQNFTNMDSETLYKLYTKVENKN